MVNTSATNEQASLFRRIWKDDTFSSLLIMGMRVGMLAAKFILSVFMARYMGLEKLGIYGLIVGASGTIQAVLRGGIFPLLSRDAVDQPLSHLTYHLRHYGTGILVLYTLLIPIALAAGWYFDAPALGLLALAVFFTEHISFDAYILINNLEYPKLANFIYSLQSASWIYLFVVLAFLHPEFRTLPMLLTFWIGGGVITTLISLWLTRRWPWKKSFKKKLLWLWYPGKLKRAFDLYLTDVLGVANYYMDRYIVTVFLSLEMTGIYVFFSQIVTATWNLVNSGVLVLFRPRLIKTFDKNNRAAFKKIFKACLVRTYMATLGLAALAGLTVPFIVRFTDNEALLSHLPLLWIMLGALMFKITETSASTGLYAMQKDRETFIMNVISFLLTAVIGSLAIITFGVYGIVLNTIIVSTITTLYARSVWATNPSPITNREAERYA